MNAYQTVLERSRREIGQPRLNLDDVYRRRDRKRRNQRLAAGAVGLAVGLVVLALGGAFLRSSGDSQTADWPSPSITTTRLVRSGEVLLDPYASGDNPTYVIAADVATGAQRTVAGCEAGCRLLTPFDASADGGWIAYHLANCEQGECAPSDPRGGLWVVGAEGSPRFVADGFLDAPWSWSPTGAQLAYADIDELILLDPTTWERTSIAAAAGSISTIAWGPDGRSIAYSVEPPSTAATEHDTTGVFVVRSGGQPRRVSDALGTVGMSWSPDGESLLLDRTESERSVIEIVGADGSHDRVLVEGSASEGPGVPVWSPDARRIAFLRTPGEPGDVALEFWVIDSDGGGEHRLGVGDIETWMGGGPVWSPDSELVAWASGFGGSWVAVNASVGGVPQPIDRLMAEQWRQG